MNKSRTQDHATEDDLLEVLMVISVVSMRLARKLTLLSNQRQSTKGVNEDERISKDHR